LKRGREWESLQRKESKKKKRSGDGEGYEVDCNDFLDGDGSAMEIT
jgi:hypothetical protein